ncbi:OCIA domain-containing protein 1-like isoform X2 [Hydractinia symbiolongicarpus]|uniref:OCIA domain-containing protein 1-like isoform X2 n=1 Tax=Hydractinia symbiolongicarpus TaxID=13093 RepID=UPI00254DF6FA|nr:OCIA domain-containing protein 1-like isoform X2 [Hydractinia symbiolongicarpus]
MNKSEQNKRFKDPHARAPVKLTQEEIQVLKECRVNSLYYRGIPAGIFSVIVARGAVKSGYFPRLQRWSGAFYAGMFGLGMFSGVASYRDECFRKIMSLENSVLAEQFRNFQREHGLPVNQSPKSEFTEASQHSEISDTTSTSDVDSLLMKRMQDQGKWAELRQASRQSHIPTKSSEKGLSYEELRLRNRSKRQGETENHVLDKTRAMDFESFTSSNFNDNKSALDFSKDDEIKTSLFTPDTNSSYENKKPPVDSKQRKTYAQATRRKNAYGDEIE